MDEDMLTDITLDHLPELSDASVSFQIPAHDADADLLLTDHTGSFDLLCRASGSDTSFAPASPTRPRGPPLTLSELTPRVLPPRKSPSRSPTPTAPAVPTVQLTLRRRSPRKRQPSPSSVQQVARPLVSEERLDHLRTQVETLHQADASHGFPDNPPPSSPISKSGVNTRSSEDPPREERETGLGSHISVTQDAVARDNAPADTPDIALPTPRPDATRNPRTTAKPTVAAGGVSKRTPFPTTHVSKKAKNKPSRTREAHNVPLTRQPNSPQSIAIDVLQVLVPPAKTSGDTDTKSKNTQIIHPGTGGLAERLVSYSQRLISSIGLYKPYSEGSAELCDDAVQPEDTPTETRTLAGASAPSPPHQTMNDSRSTHHEPFRLSEISPHKPLLAAPQSNSPGHTGNLQDGRSAVSPVRPAKKRASTDVDLVPDGHLRKKGKTRAADVEARGLCDEGVSQAQTLGQHEEVTHGRTTRQVESTMPNARTKYRPRFDFSSGCKGPTLDPFPYLSHSRQVRRSWIKGKRGEGRLNTAQSGSLQSVRPGEGTRDENAVRSCHRHAREPFGVGDLPLIDKKQNTTSCVPLTKPAGFTFRVDARLEARKEERLTASEPGHAQSERCEPKPPRFVSLSGRPPSLASVPVVPFNFCTEQRAKEREKFDTMVRRKEEEAERIKEEVRRQEAEVEEREIRELRRRAVPKANAIPEWYADMPKKRPV